MTEPRLNHVQCLDPRGLHRMAYWEWGDAANPRVLLCVHGLARQGRDFDVLAQAMLGEYRVVCPDVVGRGHSEWLADPMSYGFPLYVADMVTLIARLDPAQLDWVGTSMGGLIGLFYASLAGASVRRLVLNDVGPKVEAASIARIGQYLGVPVRWETVDEAADYLWWISQSFGPHTREQWLALTRPQLRPDDQGGFKLHYDPAIAMPIRATTPEMAAAGEAHGWAAYDRLSCATLVLRGSESDLLSHETAMSMTQRGPRAQVHELAGIGHAPTLLHPEQIEAVRKFLLSP
ncbi:MAG TPA: alpha/beta hydrolase [Burkholderiaceae bacterium]|nr:alpha/beta hydrolase [Burkholderiaceae bacterium]